jgi:hypothetical protein
MSWTCPTRVRVCVEVVVPRRRELLLLLALRVRPLVERAVDRRVPVLRRVVVGLSAPELLLVAISFSAPFDSKDITSKFKDEVIHRTHVCTPGRPRRYTAC